MEWTIMTNFETYCVKNVLISTFLYQTKAQATHDLLRDKYNRAVATQIQLTVRRYHSFSILFTMKKGKENFFFSVYLFVRDHSYITYLRFLDPSPT